MAASSLRESDWLKAVAVHMGSRLGNDPKFAAQAKTLGSRLPQSGFKDLYYGDGAAGTMGVVAMAAIENGANVYGVSLDFFLKAQSAGLPGAKESKVVSTMHARMVHMRHNSQANVMLPGSYGTMEEGLEWLCAENGHIKPQIIVNPDGYWDGYQNFLEAGIESGVESPLLRDRFRFVASADEAIEALIEINSRPQMPDPGAIIRPARDEDYLTETKHALIVRPAPLAVMSRLLTRIVTYDISNVPGQTVFHDPVIKPVIFVNEGGRFSGMRAQLKTIFENGFSPFDRLQFFHHADSMDEANYIAGHLDDSAPILPVGSLVEKHPEAERAVARPSPARLAGSEHVLAV